MSGTHANNLNMAGRAHVEAVLVVSPSEFADHRPTNFYGNLFSGMIISCRTLACSLGAM